MTSAPVAPPEAAVARWLPAFVTLALVWGSSFLFIKVAVDELPPVYVAFGRVLLGALTLAGLLALRRVSWPRERALWLHLGALALLANTIPFTLFAYAEERVSSVLAGIWNGAVPLTTLAVTLVALRSERPTRSRQVGLLVGFVGVLVVLGAWRVGGASLSGQLMLLGAVSCYGVAINYVRWVMQRYNETSGLALSAGQLALSTAQLAVIAPLVAGAPPALGSLSPGVIGSMLALGALGSGVAFLLSYHVISVAGVTTGSMVTYLIPVVAAAVGVALLDEHLTWNQPVGGLVVLAGVAVAQGLLPLRRPAPSPG